MNDDRIQTWQEIAAILNMTPQGLRNWRKRADWPKGVPHDTLRKKGMSRAHVRRLADARKRECEKRKLVAESSAAVRLLQARAEMVGRQINLLDGTRVELEPIQRRVARAVHRARGELSDLSRSAARYFDEAGLLADGTRDEVEKLLRERIDRMCDGLVDDFLGAAKGDKP